MKEDAGAVVFEAPEAAGIGLDGLDAELNPSLTALVMGCRKYVGRWTRCLERSWRRPLPL